MRKRNIEADWYVVDAHVGEFFVKSSDDSGGVVSFREDCGCGCILTFAIAVPASYPGNPPFITEPQLPNDILNELEAAWEPFCGDLYLFLRQLRRVLLERRRILELNSLRHIANQITAVHHARANIAVFI